jgi:hypothetical protein
MPEARILPAQVFDFCSQRRDPFSRVLDADEEIFRELADDARAAFLYGAIDEIGWIHFGLRTCAIPNFRGMVAWTSRTRSTATMYSANASASCCRRRQPAQ